MSIVFLKLVQNLPKALHSWSYWITATLYFLAFHKTFLTKFRKSSTVLLILMCRSRSDHITPLLADFPFLAGLSIKLPLSVSASFQILLPHTSVTYFSCILRREPSVRQLIPVLFGSLKKNKKVPWSALLGPLIWNNLSFSVRHAPTPSSFKSNWSVFCFLQCTI